MKILIVGGGIGGVTLASLLDSDNRFDVTIIEKFPEWRTVGFGILFWRNGIRLLRKLSLGNSFWESVFELSGAAIGGKNANVIMETRKSNNDDMLLISIERDILHRALVNKIKNTKVRFNQTITSLMQASPDSSVEVVFSDKSKERFDLVVGADGIYSQTRSFVFGNRPLKSYNWLTWVTWFDRPNEYKSGAFTHTEAGRFLLYFSMKNRSVAAFCAAKHYSDLSSDALATMSNTFNSLGDKERKIISEIESAKNIYHTELYYVDLKEWYLGRTVLIGDAQHGRSLISGMGTTFAMDDAMTLAKFLVDYYDKGLDETLEAFSHNRRKKQGKLKIFIWFIETAVMRRSKFDSLWKNVLLRLLPEWSIKLILNQVFKQ